MWTYNVYLRETQVDSHVYVNQPDTRFIIEFVRNTCWLDMFRTSMVHPLERLQVVCCEFGSSSYNRITSRRIE